MFERIKAATISIGVMALVLLATTAGVYGAQSPQPGQAMATDAWVPNERSSGPPSAAIARTPTPVPGVRGRFDVGGFKLFIDCSGSGSPTVVMDSGLAVTHEAWAKVQPMVARFTRVCVYDRAGLGDSDRDPGRPPRTSQRIVDELRALLAKAGVSGPYVLVGHSFGGLNVRLYASQHPREVVGLVLVDAAHENQIQRLSAVMSPMERAALLESCHANAEGVDFDVSGAQVRMAVPLPDIPLIVLSRGLARGTPVMDRVWQDLQADLAHRVPHSTHIIAKQSGHCIQNDQPDLVADAVRQAIMAARDN